jgi:hypothetical protein
VVDGEAEARPAHGGIVPVQLRGAPQRRLPAMEPQWQPDGRPWNRCLATEQRDRAGEAGAAQVEEHLQEALHRLCLCGVPKPGGSSPRAPEADERHVFAHGQCQDEDALLVHEEVVHRKPRDTITRPGSKSALEFARRIASTASKATTSSRARYITSALQTRLTQPSSFACAA